MKVGQMSATVDTNGYSVGVSRSGGERLVTIEFRFGKGLTTPGFNITPEGAERIGYALIRAAAQAAKGD